MERYFATSLFKLFDEEIDEGERSFGLTDESISRWHQILNSYLDKQPSSSGIVSLIEQLRGTNPAYKKLVPIIDSMSKNADFKATILHFYQNVDHYLEAYGQ